MQASGEDATVTADATTDSSPVIVRAGGRRDRCPLFGRNTPRVVLFFFSRAPSRGPDLDSRAAHQGAENGEILTDTRFGLHLSKRDKSSKRHSRVRLEYEQSMTLAFHGRRLVTVHNASSDNAAVSHKRTGQSRGLLHGDQRRSAIRRCYNTDGVQRRQALRRRRPGGAREITNRGVPLGAPVQLRQPPPHVVAAALGQERRPSRDVVVSSRAGLCLRGRVCR